MSTVALVHPETGEIVPAARVELGVIDARRPSELVAQATEAATALARVITDRKLYSDINGRRFVRCEGWTSLAAMMGFLPREVSAIRQLDGGYEATVELVRMSDSQVMTRASAECGMDEATWSKRSAYARRSMASTRATSKACRLAFSWVMAMAGYEVTPAEEIPGAEPESPGPTWPFGKHKGKPLAKMASDELTAAKLWCEQKDAKKFAELIQQIDDELDSRREVTT